MSSPLLRGFTVYRNSNDTPANVFYFRAIVLTNKKTDLSLVILEPFNTIAMEVLENQLSTFELNTDFSEYPIEPQGT